MFSKVVGGAFIPNSLKLPKVNDYEISRIHKLNIKVIFGYLAYNSTSNYKLRFNKD